MLYHSDDAAYEYIKNKRQYPEGNLHLRFGNYRRAFRQQNGMQNNNDKESSESDNE